MKKHQIKKYLGFTLVELIIVISILAILATVAFVSFQNYTKSSRDSTRLATISTLEKGLEVYNVKVGTYPLPDNKATITLSGVEVSYQGILGYIVSKKINSNKTPLDPLDNTSYFYATNTSQKGYKLLGYSENQTSYTNNQAYAIDYTTRNQITKGGLPIITDSNKNVIQTNIDLFTNGSGILYNEILDDKTIITGSGIEIGGGYQMLSLKNGNYGAPKSCPDGFIPVIGSADFSQPGFCVAKYEMSYDGITTPDSSGTTWNSISYLLHSGSSIVSKSGNYPIGDITQAQAIQECSKIGGHLMTNNEWMTLARQIEKISYNWSTGIVGSGGIYRGITALEDNLGCKAKGGNTELYSRVTKTGNGIDSQCDKKRIHKLSNGEIIWDLSGNVREHVNKGNTINGLLFNNGKSFLTGCSAPTLFSEWTTCNEKFNTSLNLSYSSLQGIGKVSTSTGLLDNVYLRGGSDYRVDNNGVFALNLAWNNTNYAGNVGFRCTY